MDDLGSMTGSSNQASKMRSPSVVIYGCGDMGLLIASMLRRRGAEIRGAIARSPRKVGQDLGTLAGGTPIGVIVEEDADVVLSRARADVVVIATTSPLPLIQHQIQAAAEHGSNVVTLEEQSFNPWFAAPDEAHRLDAVARASGVSILGTGLQDLWWTALPAMLMSATQSISHVRGRSTYNTDDFGGGSSTAGDQGILGRSPETLERLVRDGSWAVTTVVPVAQTLAVLAGLTPGNHHVDVRPVIAERPRRSQRYQFVVETGSLLGYSESVTLTTVEGPVIEFEMTGYLHGPGEASVNDWSVEGDSYVEHKDHRFDARVGTAAAVINRVPDLIAANPGFVTALTLPPLRYRHGPLLVR